MTNVWLSAICADRHYEEELHTIQTNLLLNTSGEKVLSLVPLTSVQGTLAFAVSLARSFSYGQRNVLLINLDQASEETNEDNIIFERQEATGLFDILVDGLDAEACIYQTDIDGLYYMPAGTPAEHPVELLGGTSYEYLMAALKEQYDYVFLLAPALNASLEGVTASRIADGSILITESGTSFTQVRKHLEMLKKGAPVIGNILIKKQSRILPLPVKAKKTKKKRNKALSDQIQ